MTSCVVCGRHVDPGTTHHPHHPECPQEGCQCDLTTCPDCCPDCTRAAVIEWSDTVHTQPAASTFRRWATYRAAKDTWDARMVAAVQRLHDIAANAREVVS